MGLSLPTLPQIIRLFRFILSLIVAAVLGTAFRNVGFWDSGSKRAGEVMLFSAIITILYDTYTFLFSADHKIHDCTYSRRYKFLHTIYEGILCIFWFAALGAVATAIDGMLEVDASGNVIVKRQDSGSGNSPTAGDGTTTMTTTTTPGGGADWETAAKSKSMVVGSVACAGLVGACSLIIWIMVCHKLYRI